MKSKIYLKDEDGKYQLFEYEILSEVAQDMIDRGISINDKLQVIGDNCRLGNGVSITETTTIGKNVTINDNCVIAGNCTIKDKVTLGTEVIVNSDVLISEECVVGNGVTLASGIKLGKLAKVEDNVNLQDKFLIIGSVGEITYVGNDKICIGCTSGTIEDWEANGVSLGRDFGYTNDQIGEYKRYVELAKDFIYNINNPA